MTGRISLLLHICTLLISFISPVSGQIKSESINGLSCFVINEKGTEKAFTGKYYDFHEAGSYHCARCNEQLFLSDAKYNSGSGWPSYFQPASSGVIATRIDTAFGWSRVEAVCANCEAHLGHIFNDGPKPTGKRYCINSVSLEFKATQSSENLDSVILGAGCFWCVEAVFLELKAVKSVEVGYAGGQTLNPTYDAVCSGRTGHAEVVKVVFDKTEISLAQILEVFFKTHNPTTLNQQGYDKGTQYRSVIFYDSPEDYELAQSIIDDLNESGAYEQKIVTTLEPLKKYYRAEEYHQNYYLKNPEKGYCARVIQPKLEKYQKVFKKYNN